jgi:hypothetical protein
LENRLTVPISRVSVDETEGVVDIVGDASDALLSNELNRRQVYHGAACADRIDGNRRETIVESMKDDEWTIENERRKRRRKEKQKEKVM